MNLIKRSTQLLRDEGPSGLAKGAYRYFWWNGGMNIEYQIRSLFDLPAKREIRDVSSSFIIGNKGELKRVTAFSGEKPILEWLTHQIKIFRCSLGYWSEYRNLLAFCQSIC